MAFFDSFADSIKQKWLQFFQVNRDWITLQMTIESVYTPDGGKRPSSYLILGVVNALEPKLAQLMFPFAKLNPDADTLIEVLGLHFDPDILLGNRLSPTQEPEMYADITPEVTEDISEEQLSVTEEFTLVEETNSLIEEDSSTGELNTGELNIEENGFDDVSLSSEEMITDSFQSTPELDTGEEFGDMSFDSMNLTDNNDDSLDNLSLSDDNDLSLSDDNDLSLSDDNGFDEFRDVWGEDQTPENGEEKNEILLGEELPSDVFDESEMARLFPNN